MRLCTFEGCSRPYLAKGYCARHYQKLAKPEPNGRASDPEERFWRLTDKGRAEDCWKWLGAPTERYGTLSRPPHMGGTILAHRYSYELHHGSIPPGMLVMHTCDNPRCVNPAHLRAGTPKENMADMDAKGRRVIAYAKGEKSHLSVLNEHAVRFIRSTDLTTAELARIFGLTHQAIRAVRIRKSWKHLP